MFCQSPAINAIMSGKEKPEKKMAYEKTYDLLDLAIWMQSTREGVSLADIARRFNVSRRTAERMRDLIVTRFPQTEEIVGENNVKRWYIPQGTLKDFIQFTAEELSALETAVALFAERRMDDKKTLLESVAAKIRASVKPDVYRRIETDSEALLEAEGFICRPGPKLKISPEVIGALRQAILACKRVKIVYVNKTSGKKSTNVIDPYGFLYGERNHYLAARHSDGFYGDEVHNFILANIVRAEVLDEPFAPVVGFSLQKYAEQSFGAWHEQPFEVEWLFDKEAADEAAQYVFHPTQKTRRNADGSLTVCFKAGGRVEMDWHLYTWGKHVRVIRPADWYEKK